MKKIMSIIAIVLIGLSAQSQLPHQYELYEFEGIEYKNVYMWQESPAVPIYRGHDTMYIGYYVDTFDLSRIVRFVLPGTTSQYVRGDGSFASFPTIPTNTNQLTNGAGFITGYTESDPVFASHAANGLTGTLISNWNTAYSWGDHATAGYLTSFTEVDGSTTNEIELPSQSGNSGKYLTTNGSTASWVALNRQETYSGTTDANGQYTVTFGTAYSVAPNIQVQIVGGSANQVATCTVSTTGFTVTVYQRNTVTLLGSEVLLASTTVASGVDVDVLITEK